MKSLLFHTTKIGRLAIAGTEEFITNLYFADEAVPDSLRPSNNPLLEEAVFQLDEYLAGKRKYFTLPFKPEGTLFMQEVWYYLLTIPYGEILSYKDIAINMGKPNAYRAVGLACKKNPLPIFIPCHRVIRNNGDLAGYRGGLDLKKKLIALEWQHSL